MKLEQNKHEVTEKRAASVNINIICLWDTLDIQPEKLSEGKHTDINGESGYNGKDEDFPEEVMPVRKFIFKKFPEISQHWKLKGS